MNNQFKKYTFLFLASLSLIGCQTDVKEEVEQLPNILWISAEDLSPRMAAYGDSTISTPNLDKLANEGVVYDHVSLQLVFALPVEMPSLREDIRPVMGGII